MKKIKEAKNLLCAILVICMTFFAGISAFAENSIVAAPNSDATFKASVDNHKQYLEDAVVKLVQEGKLSKDKAEKIFEFKKRKSEELGKLSNEQNNKMKKHCKKGSLLSELKQEGIITDAEAQIIRLKLHERNETRVADGMQSLVDKGVLTPKDIDNIRGYMVKTREERKVRIEKLKAMTPEERKMYFSESKNERKDIIAKMVEDKVITEKQADEIRKAVPELNRSRSKGLKHNRSLQ
jgi:hypothetical protein